MFNNVYRISHKDDWNFFPVYTGNSIMSVALDHFANIRAKCSDRDVVNKLRIVPEQGKFMHEYSELNYLPYIIYEDFVIEINDTITKQEELEKIKQWFDEYIILKEEDC